MVLIVCTAFRCRYCYAHTSYVDRDKRPKCGAPKRKASSLNIHCAPQVAEKRTMTSQDTIPKVPVAFDREKLFQEMRGINSPPLHENDDTPISPSGLPQPLLSIEEPREPWPTDPDENDS